ncbi:MAG: hypothetical protein AAGA30_21340, partial [Planctomycetota bacterium]
QSEVERIFGNWQAVSGVLAGKAMPDEIVAATKLTISENRYSVNLAGTIDSGCCVIQDDTYPIKMKLDGNHGPNSGKTFFAILEWLSVDEIRIAYDLSGSDYPNTFEPTSQPTSYVATFKSC